MVLVGESGRPAVVRVGVARTVLGSLLGTFGGSDAPPWGCGTTVTRVGVACLFSPPKMSDTVVPHASTPEREQDTMRETDDQAAFADFPEHGKLNKVLPEMKAVTAFTDWLQSEGMVIAEKNDHGTLTPIAEASKDLIDRFYGIDNAVLVAERSRLYDELRTGGGRR